MSLKQTLKNLKSQVFSSHQNLILHNRWVLYFIFFISLADLFYLSVEKDFNTIAIFILVGFLTSFFSKNMLVILFIALVVSNVLKYGVKITKEGFEASDEDTNQDDTEDSNIEKPEEEENSDEREEENSDENSEDKENFVIESSSKTSKQAAHDSSKKVKSTLVQKKDESKKQLKDRKKDMEKKKEMSKLSQNTEKLKRKISDLMSKFNLS